MTPRPGTGEQDTGHRLVRRELMFYLDAMTGVVLDSWANPWTNETAFPADR